MKKIKKVYCDGCGNLDVQADQYQQMFSCLSPKAQGNWLSPTLPGISPDQKNADNDCEDWVEGEKITINSPMKTVDLGDGLPMPNSNKFNLQ